MRNTRFLAAPLVALLLAACGGGGGGGGSYATGPGTNPGNNGGNGNNSSPNTVTLTADAFSPSVLAVAAGTTVTWNWNSCTDSGGYGGYSTCVSHDILFDDGSNITSGSMSSGTFSRTFSAAGTYKYHCTIHGAAMSGEVDVK